MLTSTDNQNNDKQQQFLSTPLTDLKISTRAKNAMRGLLCGIHKCGSWHDATVGDIVNITERQILGGPGFGRVTIKEFKEVLAANRKGQ